MGGYDGAGTTRKGEILDMNSNTWMDMGELPASRSALASGVVIFNSLLEDVRESLRWQKEEKDGEDMDGVEGDILMEEDDSDSDTVDISDDSDMIVD